MAAPKAHRRAHHPLRRLERALFRVYGPADVRDPESRRPSAPPLPTGPTTVHGETVPDAPRDGRGAVVGGGVTGTAAPLAAVRGAVRPSGGAGETFGPVEPPVGGGASSS